MRTIGGLFVGLSIGTSALFYGAGLRPAQAGDAAAGASEEARVAEREGEATGAQQFEAGIAPLLARHCLECHGSASKKGGLDLSRKDAALAGGESGDAIVPGKATESLLWQYVESDEMPLDRPPLSDEEKRLLRQWIDAGGVWSLDVIDPAIHGADPRAAGRWVQRLTVPEYIETVRSAVGVDVEQDALRLLPPDLRADGFSNTAYNLSVDLGHVEAYAKLAEIIVEQMDVPRFAAEYTQSRELTEANLRELISGMGKWLLRGPLEEREVAAFLRVATAVVEEGGDFNEAASYVVEAMLQSPRFIYRIERQRAEGSARPVGDYELASRLSYILWGGPPDKELMRAADAGRLSERSDVRAQVRRMLEDPRVVERSTQFVHEWLNLDRLANLRPNPDRFPEWDARIAADMRDETRAFFREIAWQQNRPLADLMNAQVTFATPRLAEHYGLERNGDSARPQIDGPLRGADRDGGGLQALYTFAEGRGDVIRDTSKAGTPLDLRIEDAAAVQWNDRGLTISEPTLIATAQPPKRLIAAIGASGAVSLEAWITPADTAQSGPARILTLSSGVGQRNFTLGQEGDKYDVRLRATKTDRNGLPSVTSPSKTVQPRPTHLVYTRDATGRAKLYVDGEQTAAGNIDGDLSNWDDGFRLAVANETTKERPWRGTLHAVAIYSRALSPEEIRSGGRLRYDLSSVPGRGGLLSQASVLTVGGDEASMVARGLFVLRNVLGGAVQDPPPCVDTTPVPSKPGMSQREIALGRIADASCTGCHSQFEPLAFGLEKFDGLGAYHEKDEHGNKLRDDGEILFPGEAEPVAYESASELMDLLAGSERVRKIMTRKVAQFAISRPLVGADARVLDEIHQAAQEGGGTYASLITAIVMSDLVQMTQTESPR